MYYFQFPTKHKWRTYSEFKLVFMFSLCLKEPLKTDINVFSHNNPCMRWNTLAWSCQLLNLSQTSSYWVKEFIWGQLEIMPQSDTHLSPVITTAQRIRPEIGNSPQVIWLRPKRNQGMPVISKESMKQKGYVCLKVGKEAEESYLLKSVPQKLFKAKDVQDPNFKSGIPGWNGEKHRSLTAGC